MTQYEVVGEEPPFVMLEEGQYLLDAMVMLRPYRPLGGGGYTPPDWAEINAFAKATGRIKETWEKELISRMCVLYLKGYAEGQEVLSIAPTLRDDPDG